MPKLFIICGHGEVDPGAVGNGYQEAERVRELAKKIKYYGGDNVIIGDTTKNWFSRYMLNNDNVPKGSLVLELHMDSGASTARGAHVIIQDGFKPDKYDTALAKYLSGVLKGRSDIIVPRNLRNSKLAKQNGINYRLAECGFITSAEDVKIFNTKMDEIAIGIIKSFGFEPITKEKQEVKQTEEKMYRVQVGAYKSKVNAEELKQKLIKSGYQAYIVESAK